MTTDFAIVFGEFLGIGTSQSTGSAIPGQLTISAIQRSPILSNLQNLELSNSRLNPETEKSTKLYLFSQNRFLVNLEAD